MQSDQSNRDQGQDSAPAALDQDEILILRDTDTTAAAVAHLAAARLHALLAREDDEPGVDMAWFDFRGEHAEGPDSAEAAREISSRVQKRLEGMSLYVRTRGVEKGEQLYIFDGGRNWTGESAAYRQALDLFRTVALATAIGIEDRKGALANADRLARQRAAGQPLKLEDSIFEPEEKMGDMLPHAVEALKKPGKPVDPKPVAPKVVNPGTVAEPVKTMSVGEPPVGLKPPSRPKKQSKAKKPN